MRKQLNVSAITNELRGNSAFFPKYNLSEEHTNELDELLAPYIEHGRRANCGKPSRGRRSEGQQRSPTELHAIRQWAREQGLQVSDRGCIAADILAKYDAAH